MTLTPTTIKSCWILTDGSAGMINQCLGIAEALGVSAQQKIIKLKAPWKWFTPYLRVGAGHSLSSKSDPLDRPFPDLVISCGRQAILPALWIKLASSGCTKVVHIQDPKIKSSHFDALLVPYHDNVQGANVIQTLGAPHQVSLQKMSREKEKFPEFNREEPTQKVIGVLIGGPCGAYRMEPSSLSPLIKNIKKWAADGHKVLISPSRRTPVSVIDSLRREVGERAYVWNQQGQNPYFALLGASDAILVTCDSVCMITEACVSTAPVYLIPLPGGNKRSSHFHKELISRGRIQWWDEKIPLSFVTAESLNENNKAATQLKELLHIQTLDIVKE